MTLGPVRRLETQEVPLDEGHWPRRTEHCRHELPPALLDEVDAELSRLDGSTRKLWNEAQGSSIDEPTCPQFYKHIEIVT